MPKRTLWPPCKVCSRKKQEHGRQGDKCLGYVEMPIDAVNNGRWRTYWAGLDVRPATWKVMQRAEASAAILEDADA